MSNKKAPKNKYVTNSHLSERKFRELLRLFCADVAALSAASLTGLNRNALNRYYGMFRTRIAETCEADSPFEGEGQDDCLRPAQAWGQGLQGFDHVRRWFRLLRRPRRLGHRHHYRVRHGDNELVERGNPGNHINGIESFWGYVKNRLVKCQGISKEDFYLQLKECEFRFNMRGQDMYKFMLGELRERSLN